MLEQPHTDLIEVRADPFPTDEGLTVAHGSLRSIFAIFASVSTPM